MPRSIAQDLGTLGNATVGDQPRDPGQQLGSVNPIGEHTAAQMPMGQMDYGTGKRRPQAARQPGTQSVPRAQSGGYSYPGIETPQVDWRSDPAQAQDVWHSLLSKATTAEDMRKQRKLRIDIPINSLPKEALAQMPAGMGEIAGWSDNQKNLNEKERWLLNALRTTAQAQADARAKEALASGAPQGQFAGQQP